MSYSKDFMQHFRDAEADGQIGIRGYLGYFMDIASEQLYGMGLGNDSLPERCHCAWIYTKYSLKIRRRENFKIPFHAETWISQQKKARIRQDMEIGCGDEIYCTGRVESCLMQLEERKLMPLSAVGITENLAEDRIAQVPDFVRPDTDTAAMHEIYGYRVRYSDLDKSSHMTNLRYVPMFLDACPPEFYETHEITAAQVHFLSQAYYGECLKIFMREEAACRCFASVKEDGSLAAWMRMEYTDDPV